MARRRNSGPPFVMMEKNTLRCQDWKQLSHTEMIAYLYLKANYNGSNNGKIQLPYKSMEAVMAHKTLSTALKGLVDKGWIERTQRGGLYRYVCHYRLTGKYDLLRDARK